MAPPPMGRLDVSSVSGGRKDESDLRVGNTGWRILDPHVAALREIYGQKTHKLDHEGTIDDMFVHGDMFVHIGYDMFDRHGDMFVHTVDEMPMRVVPVGTAIDFSNLWRKKTTTQGHDDLGKYCAKYAEFAKRHPVFKISTKEPSEEVVLQISGINPSAATHMKGNLMSKYIFMMSTGDDRGFGSEGTSATHTTGGNHQSGTDLATNDKPIVILDTGAAVNVTGDAAIFVSVFFEPEGFDLRAANGNEMESYFCGYLRHEMYHMNYVYFSEDVGPRTIISGPELDLLGYSLKFEGGTCEVRDKGFLVGKGRLVGKKMYLMDFLKIPLRRVPVQVPNVEDVPVPDGPVGRPLSGLIHVWTAIRAVLRRFSGSLFKRAGGQAPRRPPV